jgi:hypothetical protein
MWDTHCLEEQGEIWRKRGIALAQAFGPIDGEYVKIIVTNLVTIHHVIKDLLAPAD